MCWGAGSCMQGKTSRGQIITTDIAWHRDNSNTCVSCSCTRLVDHLVDRVKLSPVFLWLLVSTCGYLKRAKRPQLICLTSSFWSPWTFATRVHARGLHLQYKKVLFDIVKGDVFYKPWKTPFDFVSLLSFPLSPHLHSHFSACGPNMSDCNCHIYNRPDGTCMQTTLRKQICNFANSLAHIFFSRSDTFVNKHCPGIHTHTDIGSEWIAHWTHWVASLTQMRGRTDRHIRTQTPQGDGRAARAQEAGRCEFTRRQMHKRVCT